MSIAANEKGLGGHKRAFEVWGEMGHGELGKKTDGKGAT